MIKTNLLKHTFEKFINKNTHTFQKVHPWQNVLLKKKKKK